jgi:hypothetical protein
MFIHETISKNKIQIEELLSCMNKLGISLNDVKGFSLTILALNKEVKDSQFSKDTLLPILLKTEENIPTTNTKAFYDHLKANLKKEGVKTHYDHYQLF